MYILAPNGTAETYPYSIGQLRKDNLQVSFPRDPSPELLASYGVYPVKRTDQPTHNPILQGFRELKPTIVNGEWVQTWEVYDFDPARVAENLENLKASIAAQTQERLDAFARTRNYEGILSLCSYLNSANPRYAAEAAYGVQARDATWDALYAMLAEVEAGTRPIPSGFEDIEPNLPPLIWPE